MKGCLGAIVLVMWMLISPGSFLTVTILGLIIGGFIIYKEIVKEKKKDKLDFENQEKEKERIKILMNTYDIPEDSKIINIISGNKLIGKNNFKAFIWINDKILHIVDESHVDNTGKKSILIENILYYQIDGELHREMDISGGGVRGGGSSLGGAVAGGLIAGDAGAVIGSRKKIESNPIISKTTTYDDRRMCLNFLLNGEKDFIVSDYEGYKILLDIMPEKSFKNIHDNYIMNKSKNKNQSISSKIKEIAKLRDEGLLNEEEYQRKKEEILERI